MSNKIKNPRRGKTRRMAAVVLSAVILLAMIPAVGRLKTAAADGPVGDVIFNYPYNTLQNPVVDDVIWTNTKDHPGYEQAYTQAESARYNGTAAPDHVVLKDNWISFYGYGVPAYMDYVFTEGVYPVTRGNAFIMRPVWMNYHSFNESGYLFNGTMVKESGGTYYTGYAIVLSCANMAGMMERDHTAPNTAALRLYYIEHELWNTEQFKPGNISSTRTLISTFKTGITDVNVDAGLASTPYRVSTEIDPATRAFRVYVDGSLRTSVPAEQVLPGGNGFGFFTGHYAHNCTILTCIRYEDVTVDVDLSEEETTAQVHFIDRDTGTTIRAPEVKTGVEWQKYRIRQPLMITYDGDDYYLDSNSRGAPIHSEIKSMYAPNPAENETTLYYVKKVNLASQSPVKEARVNGGEWDNGAAGAPVTVTAGDEIEYSITVYAAPSSGEAVMKNGDQNSGISAVWFGQPSEALNIRKQDVETVTFVNLPERYANLSNFVVSSGGVWAGKDIAKSWDATYAPAELAKVFAWVTAGAEGGYDLYIGGYGGVLLNDGAYLFNEFTGLKSADLRNLRAGEAARMTEMFSNCSSLTSLDIRGFDTSKVTNMSRLFAGCSSLALADLSSLDTSSVTDMSYMFLSCSSLTELDLRSFNTSNATDMTCMFKYCSSLTNLDVRSFNTSGVEDLSGMFAYCELLTGIDLSVFDTSSTTDMSSMFQGAAGLASLDLKTFDTTNVRDMSDMFGDCRSLESLDLSNFDTSSVTDMDSMFSGCENLRTLDLRSFDTSRVTDMMLMFENCKALTTLDLSTFDTTSVKDLIYMFYGCESLRTLDLSSFDTSGLDSFERMFEGCASLESVDISSFDTTNVKKMIHMFDGCASLVSVDAGHFDMTSVSPVTSGGYGVSSMFAGCESLTQLDLSWWNLDITDSSNPANYSAMISGCYNLKELHLEGMTYSASTNKLSNLIDYDEDNCASDFVVYVSHEDIKADLTSGSSNLPEDNVTVTAAPSGDKPVPAAPSPAEPVVRAPAESADWRDFLTPVVAATPGIAAVTDTIPGGLIIIEASITGTEAPAAPGEISWTLEGRTITWLVPAPEMPAELKVKVTVAPGIAGTAYENTAAADGLETNSTYHALEGGYTVTEKYFLFNGAAGDTGDITALDSDRTTIVQSGSAYSVKGNTGLLYGYAYYGYRIDGAGAVIQDQPPAPVFGGGTSGHRVIELFYRAIPAAANLTTVTIHFRDKDGNTIKPDASDTVASSMDYYMPMRHFDSFADAGDALWTYYDYENAAPSAPYPQPGAAPVYPDGSLPTFTKTELAGGDKDITLYFVTDIKTVTVRFAELNNPSNILHSDEICMFSGPSLDVMTQTRAEGETLTADIDLSAEFGKTYRYAGIYSKDGGAEQPGSPGAQSSSCEVTLYFTTTFKVTEMFVEYTNSGSEGGCVKLLDDRTYTGLPGGSVFSAFDGGAEEAPQIPGYTYTGFRVGGDDDPLIAGELPAPMIKAVFDDYTIIYIYEKDAPVIGPGGPGNPGNPGDETGGTSGSQDKPADEKPTDNGGSQPGTGERPGSGESSSGAGGQDGGEYGAGPSGERENLPGESARSVAPPVHVPGNTLVPDEDDGSSYIELSPDGVPLGRWYWSVEEETWIYEEFPPAAELPQTGESRVLPAVLLILGLLLIGKSITIKRKTVKAKMRK